MTVTVHVRLLRGTHTPNRSSLWEATAVVAGVAYTATSRMASSCELARQLVAAGVADQPLEVRTEGLAGVMVWGSFYRAAERTTQENATTALVSARWRAFPAALDGRNTATNEDTW